jgi:ABC-2 type transport system ATP-binding protein
VLADDTVRGLYRLLPASRAVVLEVEGPPPAEDLMATLALLPGISTVEYTATGGIQIETDDFGTPLARALGIIANHGQRIASVRTAKASLEDVFISLTGHALRDGPQAARA